MNVKSQLYKAIEEEKRNKPPPPPYKMVTLTKEEEQEILDRINKSATLPECMCYDKLLLSRRCGVDVKRESQIMNWASSSFNFRKRM